MRKPVVLAMTGASGAIYAQRLLRTLLESDVEVHLTISQSGAAVIKQELDCQIDLKQFDAPSFLQIQPTWSSRPLPTIDASKLTRLHYHYYENYFTPIASGSFLTRAMVVCPCSGSTLSGLARGASGNLIERAAEVHLKERRKLIVVPRETPLSVFALENMQRLASAGAVVLPASPGWYHDVCDLDSLVDFVVSRILDQLELGNAMIERWGES